MVINKIKYLPNTGNQLVEFKGQKNREALCNLAWLKFATPPAFANSYCTICFGHYKKDPRWLILSGLWSPSSPSTRPLEHGYNEPGRIAHQGSCSLGYIRGGTKVNVNKSQGSLTCLISRCTLRISKGTVQPVTGPSEIWKVWFLISSFGFVFHHLFFTPLQ